MLMFLVGKQKLLFASIRRIVQDEKFFFKIRPGLWALKTYKNKLPENILPAEKISKEKQEQELYYFIERFLPLCLKKKVFISENMFKEGN